MRRIFLALSLVVLASRAWALQIPCGDSDHDGYGVKASGRCPYTGIDCNDLNSAIHPGAAELCNGVDDNCDGKADETFVGLNQPCSSSEGACFHLDYYGCSDDAKSLVCDPVSDPSIQSRLLAFGCYQLVQSGSAAFSWTTDGQVWPTSELDFGRPLRLEAASPDSGIRIRVFERGLVVVNTNLTKPFWFMLPEKWSTDTGSPVTDPPAYIQSMLATNFQRAFVRDLGGGKRSISWEAIRPATLVQPKEVLILRARIGLGP